MTEERDAARKEEAQEAVDKFLLLVEQYNTLRKKLMSVPDFRELETLRPEVQSALESAKTKVRVLGESVPPFNVTSYPKYSMSGAALDKFVGDCKEFRKLGIRDLDDLLKNKYASVSVSWNDLLEALTAKGMDIEDAKHLLEEMKKKCGTPQIQRNVYAPVIG